MNVNLMYSKAARFDDNFPLTEDQMRWIAPSIFATTASPSKSERFRPIATVDVLRELDKEGFSPYGVRQIRSRTEDGMDFTKHLIRLRRVENQPQYRVGDTVCEVLLRNANDGTSSYELMAGLFRIACMNSLVSRISTLKSVKVRHMGNLQVVASKVIEGTYSVIEQAQVALEAPSKWSSVFMSISEKNRLAKKAADLIFPEPSIEELEVQKDWPVKNEPFDFRKLLVAKRRSDLGHDLWTTFNIVQENVLRGGAKYHTYDDHGKLRNHSTREVKSIDRSIKLNQALWGLGQETFNDLADA